MRNALEEEVFMQRDLDDDLLEIIMFEEIEIYEKDSPARRQLEKEKALLQFDAFMRNKQAAAAAAAVEAAVTKPAIEVLYDRIFVAYQTRCKKPFTVKLHERLLMKTIEKTVPRIREAIRNNNFIY